MTQVLPKERAREYESIFILHPDSQSKIVDSVAAKCQDIISDLNGKLLRAENWGRRRLAYPVKKNAKGIYIYLRYLGYQDLVHELERNFRTMDPVIKFLTVKIGVDVNPDSRPVSEADISFVSSFEEPETKAEQKPDATEINDDAVDADAGTKKDASKTEDTSKAEDAGDVTADEKPEDALESKDDKPAVDSTDAKSDSSQEDKE